MWTEKGQTFRNIYDVQKNLWMATVPGFYGVLIFGYTQILKGIIVS